MGTTHLVGARDHIARGDLLREQGRVKDALEEYQQALANNPKAITAHTGRAICLSDLGQNKEALIAVEEGLKYNAESAYAHRIRGLVLYRQGQLNPARDAVNRALELSPHDPYNFYLMAVIEHAAGSHQRALNLTEQGLSIDPTNQTLLSYRATLLRVTGKRKESLQASIEALQGDPEDVDAHISLGYAQLSNGDHREAMETFRNAVRLAPNRNDAREGLLEALRARFFLYRMLYKYSEAMARLGLSRGAISILSFIIFRLLAGVSGSKAGFPLWVQITAGLILLVLCLMWLSQPIMNIALVFHPIGKYALAPIMRHVTWWVVALLSIILISIIAAFAWRSGAGFGALGPSIGLIILALIASRPEELRSRGSYALLYIVGVLCGAMGIFGLLTGA